MTGLSVADQALEASKAALVEQIFLATGLVRIRALGLSMLPCIWPGDVLTIQSTRTADINIGDIVAVRQNDRWVVHRVRRHSAAQLIVRGDCVPENDPPIRVQDVIGKVVTVVRGSKEFAPGCSLSLFHQCLACLLCHSNRLRSLVLNFHRSRELRIRSEVRSKFKPTTASS